MSINIILAAMPAEGFYFFLDKKVTKNQVSKEASCTQAIPHKVEKTWAATFCPASLALALTSAKIAMPFPRCWPPLFSPLLAEAALLTGRNVFSLWSVLSPRR